MVIPEMMMSRSPVFSVAKMPSHGVLTSLTSKPSALAMALMMSMSKPSSCFWLFSNSNGR